MQSAVQEDGGYDTVLLILQDNAANDIEESFDSIDVVRKEGDESYVVLDGAGDGSEPPLTSNALPFFSS